MGGNGSKPGAIDQAVILAAGKGERLSPLTALRPKVMLPICNKPILEYVVEALVGVGIRDIVVVVGYQREKVQDHFGSGQRFGASIRYVHQEQQLGTGHALRVAADLVREHFLVLPGDNVITSATIRDLVRAERDTILVTDQAPGHQYGVVAVRGGLATALEEKPAEPTSPWTSTGIYRLSRPILDYVGEGLDLPGALNAAIGDGSEIAVSEAPGNWWDAAYPQDLLKLNGLALAEAGGEIRGQQEPGVVVKGPLFLGENSVLRANCYIVGPVVIGEGCEIGPGVSIFPYTSIGNNVVIESFTQIRNCVIGNSVQIGSHTHLSDSIVADGCSLGPRLTAPGAKTQARANDQTTTVQMGCVIAEDVEIGADVSIRPGTLVGHGARVREMNAVREDVPELSYVV